MCSCATGRLRTASMITTFTGWSSSEPQNRGRRGRTTNSESARTHGETQCGKASPEPNPVDPALSRRQNASSTSRDSRARPARQRRSTAIPITSAFVAVVTFNIINPGSISGAGGGSASRRPGTVAGTTAPFASRNGNRPPPGRDGSRGNTPESF